VNDDVLLSLNEREKLQIITGCSRACPLPNNYQSEKNNWMPQESISLLNLITHRGEVTSYNQRQTNINSYRHNHKSRQLQTNEIGPALMFFYNVMPHKFA
jgi:hypothetical protein